MLGNVKGTFGFVDANGEIKRVTYSSSNGTGFKATTSSPLQERASVVQSIPRSNRSSSTRKPPSVVYATSTESSSSTSTPKLTVVQSIPRSRSKTTTSASISTTSTTESPTKTVFGHYIKGSKHRPRLFVNGQQRPSSISVEEEPEDSQITRPSIEVKNPSRRKTFLGKRPLDHNLRPITEEFDEKSEETKTSPSGNNLRRQLHEETTIKVEESQESDENSDVYGGSLSTTRPLFTTSSTPRIIQRLRTDRPKVYHQMTPSSSETPETTEYDSATQTTRVYEAENKLPESREIPTQYYLRPVTTKMTPRDYTTHPGPIYIRREPEQILRDLSTGILMPQAAPVSEEEEYRVNHIDRILARLQAARQQYPEPMDVENVAEYPPENPAAMETTEPAPVPLATRRLPNNNYIRSRNYPRLVSYVAAEPEGRSRSSANVFRLQPMNAIDRDYADYPYRSIVLPPEPPNPIAPPLSRRDFQILLRRLLVSQYGVRALSHPRSYLDDALYDQQSYATYQTAYHTPPTRQLVYGEASRYGDRVRDRSGHARSFDPALYPNSHYPEANYVDPVYAKRVYRQKIYDADMNEDVDGNGDEILPPPIREALLLRMLQLAISNDRPVSNFLGGNGAHGGTTTPMTTNYRKAPVRSVQIIGDEKSEEKDTMRKKM